jgi:hypothetical protein
MYLLIQGNLSLITIRVSIDTGNTGIALEFQNRCFSFIKIRIQFFKSVKSSFGYLICTYENLTILVV